MGIELPKIESSLPPLDISHFPKKYQCFIYRNWEMITPARLADVLGCSESDVNREACALGLPESEANEELWLSRGYITVIRANWHLLPYDQLCRLLGWSEEKLCFILREDDFLDVKLGRIKPFCEKLSIEPLSDEEKARTSVIKDSTEQILKTLGKRSVEPFDFAPFYSKSTPSALRIARCTVTCSPTRSS